MTARCTSEKSGCYGHSEASLLSPEATITAMRPRSDFEVRLPKVRHPYYLSHRRLGHIGNTLYDRTVKCTDGLPSHGHHKSDCPACAAGKSKVLRHKRNARNERTDKPMQRLHMDLMGKFKHATLGGSRYALVIVDDYSRLTEVYTMKRKSDTLEMFKRSPRQRYDAV